MGVPTQAGEAGVVGEVIRIVAHMYMQAMCARYVYAVSARVWGMEWDYKGSSSPSSSPSPSPSLLCQEHEPCQRTLPWRGHSWVVRPDWGKEGRKVIAVVTKGGEEGRKGDVSPREREREREREIPRERKRGQEWV